MNRATDKHRPVLLAAVILALAAVACPAAAQTITEFPIPTFGSQPLEIASGPGGMWFTEPGAGRIGLITPDGRLSEFTVSASPLGIVAGPDGNLWFTSDGHISRMTTDGTVSKFVTACCSFPGSPPWITVGPDRLLWFTDGDIDGGKIGNSNVAGQISEKFIPSLDALGLDPATITSGPDGNLWFTEFGPHDDAKIGRVAPSGIFAEFPLPGVKGIIWGIAAGSDGNLWFTETTANKVGRITTSGDVTEFSVSGNPRGIAAGPDGTLWFTENTGNRIGRITTRGEVTEFSIPTPNSQPWGISAGPDGNIWFTENGAGRIGRISPIFSDAVDISVRPDDETSLLRFDGLSGHMGLDSLDRTGTSSQVGPFGPYPGWTAHATAAGSDGLTRVLWTNEDGSAALWLVGPQSNQASYRFGPVAGSTAIDVAASIDGTTHLLWTDRDRGVALWSIDGSGRVLNKATYGPYRGWTALAISDGADGLTRLLWEKVDGTVGLSVISSEGIVATYRYGAVGQWKAIDLAVGGDNQTRLLWSHPDGRVAIGIVNGSGEVQYGPTYSSPQGLTARHVAAGPDGSARVLFANYGVGAALWLLSPAGAFRGSLDLTEPTPSGPDITGGWVGTFDSADFIDCDSNTPAQANFERNGSTVVGVLNASQNACGFADVEFQGTLQGNILAGTLRGDRFTDASATGILLGTTLEITLVNGFGFIPGGQMHLHR